MRKEERVRKMCFLSVLRLLGMLEPLSGLPGSFFHALSKQTQAEGWSSVYEECRYGQEERGKWGEERDRERE